MTTKKTNVFSARVWGETEKLIGLQFDLPGEPSAV